MRKARKVSKKKKNKNQKKNPQKQNPQKQLLQALDSADLPQEIRDVDLTSAPELVHPGKLRPGRRAAFLSHLEGMEGFEQAETDKERFATIEAIDELLESVAINAEEYVEWVTDGKDDSIAKVLALFISYLRLLGESKRSGNS